MIETKNIFVPEIERRISDDVQYDMRKYGIVYVIRNKITKEIYIGYTTKTLEERWKGHIKSSKYTDAPYRKLYKAFGEYGIENFERFILEIVERDKLAQREKALIKLYGTYNNGYNSTRGGEGTTQINDELVEEMFLDGMELKEIANTLNCDDGTISEHLKKMGYNPRSNCTKNRSRPVEQYDINGHYIQTFESMTKAAEYVIQELNKGTTIKNIVTKIGNVCNYKRASAYDYIWRHVDDIRQLHPVFQKTNTNHC